MYQSRRTNNAVLKGRVISELIVSIYSVCHINTMPAKTLQWLEHIHNKWLCWLEFNLASYVSLLQGKTDEKKKSQLHTVYMLPIFCQLDCVELCNSRSGQMRSKPVFLLTSSFLLSCSWSAFWSSSTWERSSEICCWFSLGKRKIKETWGKNERKGWEEKEEKNKKQKEGGVWGRGHD